MHKPHSSGVRRITHFDRVEVVMIPKPSDPLTLILSLHFPPPPRFFFIILHSPGFEPQTKN